MPKVVLLIHDFKVVSFDKVHFPRKQRVEDDEQVRKHFEFIIHYLFKR